MVWVIIFVGCFLGPMSLPFTLGTLLASGTILSFILMVYFSRDAEHQKLKNILYENIQLTTWTSHERYKWVLLYVNRQSLIEYGIFGTFAAYNATLRPPSLSPFDESQPYA